MDYEDDITLPDPLAPTPYNYDSEGDHSMINKDFESLSTYDTTPSVPIKPIIESDLAHLTLNELDKKVLVSELADCNLYLRNIHKGFKHVVSTQNLISLVAAGIGVHKHRRAIIKDIKAGKGDMFELDEHGNPIKTS